MRRRQVLGAFAGGALFLLTGCKPSSPGRRARSGKWLKAIGHGAGKVAEDIATDALVNTAKEAVPQPDPNSPYTQYRCPGTYPHDCGDYCCYAGSTCCGRTCGTTCGDGCCQAGKVCCGDYCCAVGSRCCGDYCCGSDQTCCAGGCCDPGTRCCGQACCSPDEVCCGGKCCLPGAICCNGGCCQSGSTCCQGGGCCPAGENMLPRQVLRARDGLRPERPVWPPVRRRSVHRPELPDLPQRNMCAVVTTEQVRLCS